VLDPKEEERDREERERLRIRHLVKNSGSISLDNFGARLTGDGVRQDMTSDGGNAHMEGCTRLFEDGFSESMFTRDWRETRLEMDRELSPDTIARRRRDLDPEALVSEGLGKTQQASRTSPASSAVSHSSASSLRQQHRSPTHSRATNSTVHEVIDVDSIPSTSSVSKPHAKRKAAAVSSDDEVEIIEGPAMASESSKRHKGGKAPPAAKSKAKKR